MNEAASGVPSVSAARRPWQALGAAVLIEAALVLALVGWLLAKPAAPIERVVPLSIDAIPPPAPEKPQAPQAPPPPMRAVTPPPPAVSAQRPAPATPPAPQTPAPATAAPEPAPAPVAAAPAAPPVAAAAPVPAPPPPPPPAAPAVDPSVAYNARLSAAVQAAFEIPAAAAALNFKGRTRVEFSLRDGAVSGVRVVQTSGLGVADRAAVRAVQIAAFPAPPPALQGKEGVYQIWVVCY